MFTLRAHACERVFASARVVKQSLVFGRILFKFAGHILEITSSMGYVLIMFTRASTCLRARAWLNIHLSLDGFYSNLLGTFYK
jgi:hypothetical protein